MAVYDLQTLHTYFDENQISERRLKANEVLFHEGEPAQSLFFVVDGEIRTESYLADGKSIIYFRARTGAALTEEALFLPTYLYTGIATVDSQIRSIPKTDFLDKFAHEHGFCEALLGCLSIRYSDAMMVRELLAIKSAEERLYNWLHWKARLETGQRLDLTGIMGTLGPELSLTKESVYRAFAKLEEDGKITRDGGLVTLS